MSPSAFLLLTAMTCAPRDALTDRLAAQYGERLVALGIASSGEVLEVWGNEENLTWTVLTTRTDKISCIVASGGSLITGFKSPIPGAPL